MLTWIFGGVRNIRLHLSEPTCAAGYLDLERARVRWFLSLDVRDLPPDVAQKGKRTYRSIVIDGKELEFSEGFADLHTLSYQEILSGRGFGLQDARASIETAHAIRHAKPEPLKGDYHPFLKGRG